MKIWRKEMMRLGVEIAHPILGDAANPPLKTLVDRLLIDPPCSGTGSFNMFPGMKWRLDLKVVETYARLQRRILDQCSRLLRVGGIMVYSTCSVMVEEGEKVIETFLNQNPNFELLPAYPGLEAPPLMSHPGPIRLYPHVDGSYGFFIAKLKRVD
jgi:16S rRNA (cytosine967-C5)-methyltransferase